MRSHELAQILLANPDVELIMQKDSEGNGYSPLSGVDFNVIYVADSTWDGECYNADWTADDVCKDKKEWTALKRKHKSKHAVLYPVN